MRAKLVSCSYELAQRADVFVAGVWFLSRLIVVAGLVHVPHPSFTVVGNFDGVFYRDIATRGYSYRGDEAFSSVAFFPLYPAIVALFMRTGLSFNVAAVVLSNATFVAALGVTFKWIARRNGAGVARWTTAFMAFFPMSLFGSVAYTEAPYMLLSALALRDFDDRRYNGAALWTALASCTRPSGICLMPAFALAALAERRTMRALLPAAAAGTGIAAFAAFCALRFGDPLAFVHAQQMWRHDVAQGAIGWGVLLGRGTTSFDHWKYQLQVVPLIAVLLFTNRRLSAWLAIALWGCAIFVEHWCWDRDFGSAVMLLLGGASLMYFAKQLGAAALTYGLVAVALVAFAGMPISVDRILYAILPFSVAIGLFLERVRAAAPGLLWAAAYDLFAKSAAFAQNRWVA